VERAPEVTTPLSNSTASKKETRFLMHGELPFESIESLIWDNVVMTGRKKSTHEIQGGAISCAF
jgi:hypothetical protein